MDLKITQTILFLGKFPCFFASKQIQLLNFNMAHIIWVILKLKLIRRPTIAQPTATMGIWNKVVIQNSRSENQIKLVEITKILILIFLSEFS